MHQKSVSDYNNDYILSKKLALRKLTKHFKGNFFHFFNDRKELSKFLNLLSENPEEVIQELNDILIQKILSDFQKNTGGFRLQNRESQIKDFG